MTVTVPQGGDPAAQELLAAAERHFERTIAAVDDIINEVRAGQTARAKELRGALGEMGKALQTAFDERAKVEKRIKSETGGAGGYALDFDAARVEIGRRLACLRDARGAEGLSGGSG